MFKTLQASADRRPGTAVIASVMLIVLTAAGGVFYGYPQWRNGSSTATPTPVVSTAVRGSRTSRLSEKPAASNVTRSTARTTDSPERRNRVNERNAPANNAVAEQVQRLDKVKLASPSVPRRAPVPSENNVETSRRIKIPNIRLPAAEVKEHFTVPAAEPLRLDTYQPASLPVSSWTRRAPNGQTVKFSNGSLRVLRPSQIVSTVGSKRQ